MRIPRRRIGTRRTISHAHGLLSFVVTLVLVGCGGVHTDSQVRNPVCGNQVTESGETCDGPDLGAGDRDCGSFGFVTGELQCQDTCDGFDTSLCANSQCGNDIQEGGEVCDGTDLRGQTCADLGFGAGTLACSGDCMSLDTTACSSPSLSCGDNIQDPQEICDGFDLAGQTCESLGFTGGTLACQEDCTGFDPTNCTSDSAFCGNGVVENEEQCDGNNLGSNSCENMGYDSGMLACYLDCQFDTRDCVHAETCGCPDWMLGDDYCDAACNNALCHYDEGDCDPSGDCAPGCTATLLANGTCDSSCNNTACNFDNGACQCTTTCPAECDGWLSDGYCDSICNIEVCSWDAGDCCGSTCTDATFECGGTSGTGFNCLDPAACENTGGCNSCVGMCDTTSPANGMTCSCDSSCSGMGDCCSDYAAACPNSGGGGESCTGDISYVADGWCDASTNSAACTWDGGDCCESTCISNTYTCGEWAVYNCQDPSACENNGGCECTGDVSYIADGWCDASTNNAGCQWDGGDCCESTCVDSTYTCGIVGYTCTSPYACENTANGCP